MNISTTRGEKNMGDLREIQRTHYDAFNSGDLDRAMSVFDAGCELVTPLGPARGVAEHRGFLEGYFAAFPDSRVEALRTFDAGDTIVVEGMYSGTQTGDLVGPDGTIPASGRHVSVPYADFFHIRGGKVVSHHIYWDNAGFMAQLGVMPGG